MSMRATSLLAARRRCLSTSVWTRDPIVTAAMKAQYSRDGFLVIDDFLSPQQLALWSGLVDTSVEERGTQKFPQAELDDVTNVDFEYFENVFIQRVNLHKTSEAMRSLIIENAGQVIGRIACELENLQGIHCWHDQALYKSAFANPTSWYEGRRSSTSLRC
jgi:hypothetical protein